MILKSLTLKITENIKHRKNSPVARIVKNCATSINIIFVYLYSVACSFHHALQELPQQIWFCHLNNLIQPHRCLLYNLRWEMFQLMVIKLHFLQMKMQMVIQLLLIKQMMDKLTVILLQCLYLLLEILYLKEILLAKKH